jgi:hypothetical protein
LSRISGRFYSRIGTAINASKDKLDGLWLNLSGISQKEDNIFLKNLLIAYRLPVLI